MSRYSDAELEAEALASDPCAAYRLRFWRWRRARTPHPADATAPQMPPGMPATRGPFNREAMMKFRRDLNQIPDRRRRAGGPQLLARMRMAEPSSPLRPAARIRKKRNLSALRCVDSRALQPHRAPDGEEGSRNPRIRHPEHKVTEPKDSFTVVGEIPGSKTGCGNRYDGRLTLDSWTGGTGATDNAAGCAVALEAICEF